MTSKPFFSATGPNFGNQNASAGPTGKATPISGVLTVTNGSFADFYYGYYDGSGVIFAPGDPAFGAVAPAGLDNFDLAALYFTTSCGPPEAYLYFLTNGYPTDPVANWPTFTTMTLHDSAGNNEVFDSSLGSVQYEKAGSGARATYLALWNWTFSSTEFATDTDFTATFA